MAIYKIGQEIDLKVSISMRILKAFAVEDNIYYIVLIKSNDKIKSSNKLPLYGTFRHDDSDGSISEEISKMADEIVVNENLLKDLE